MKQIAKWVLGSVAVCFCFFVYAAPITHFSASITNLQADSRGIDPREPALNPSVLDPTGALVSTGLGVSFTEGSASSFGSAELGTGELKAFSRTDANGSGRLLATTGVFIGDSYRSVGLNSDPFDWNGESATFSMLTDGIIEGSGIAFAEMSVYVGILAPGDLDLYAQFLNGELTGFSVPPWEVLAGQLFSFDSPGTIDEVLSFTFEPGSDFDWFISLTTTGSHFPPFDATGTITSNFANTVTAFYDGPAGALTRSASGAILPGVSVPEPGTLALLTTGLLGLGFMRRKQAA